MATKKSTAPKSTPAKRLARDSDRAFAGELARCYFEGKPLRMGKVDVTVNGAYLAMNLMVLAECGTWDCAAKMRAAVNRDVFRYQVASFRASGLSATDAIHSVAGFSGVHEQTVLDAVYPRKARKT